MLRRDPDADRSAAAPGAPPVPDRPMTAPAPRRPLRAGLAAALLLAGLAACGGDPMAGEEAAANGAGGEAAAPSDQSPSGAVPSGQSPSGPPAGAPIGPLTSRGEPAPTPAIQPPGGGGGAGAAGRLVWELPAGWTEVPPASPMRMAQAAIPGPGGAAELVLFHFGPGGGGGVQANIDRWIGQMEVEGEPERGSFTAGDLAVTWVDVAGTLLPSGMGMGPTEPQPGSRLLGAVVEGAGGPWFFKATGPAETLSAAREDFLGMLRAARIE